jgi:hypothetical protein
MGFLKENTRMPRLYEHPLCAYAKKVKIGLPEKGLELQAVVPEGPG